MLKLNVLYICILSSFCNFAQSKIEVSYNKHVMLVFNSPIKPDNGWDCSAKESVDVIVKENKVLLQAKKESFNETNLIIELADGSLYAFDLVYNKSPKQFFYIIKNKRASYTQAITAITERKVTPVYEQITEDPHPVKTNATEVSHDKQSVVRPPENKIPNKSSSINRAETDASLARRIAKTEDHLKHIYVVDRQMHLYVGGIYVHDNKLFFKVNLKNKSSIPYKIDHYDFIINNNTDEIDQNMPPHKDNFVPVFVLEPESSSIEKNEIETFVFVFDKFAISDEIHLYIEFWERDGGRNLELSIESIVLLSAQNI